KPDLLTGITDGLGAVTKIDYEPVSNRDVYTPGKTCTYPATCIRAKLWVVAQHSVSNGNGGANTWQYKYADGRADLRGRGFLGMGSSTVTNDQTGATTVSTYDLNEAAGQTFYPF